MTAETKPKLDRSRTGRAKGTPNKTTLALKEAILKAAEMTGYDGKGKNGLTGYLRHVASTDVKAFSALLGKVLPMQITGDEGKPIQITITGPDAGLL